MFVVAYKELDERPIDMVWYYDHTVEQAKIRWIGNSSDLQHIELRFWASPNSYFSGDFFHDRYVIKDSDCYRPVYLSDFVTIKKEHEESFSLNFEGTNIKLNRSQLAKMKQNLDRFIKENM